MTALTATRSTIKMGDQPIPDLIQLPVDAAKKIYQGALVIIASNGYAQPGVAGLGQICVGRAEALSDNTGGAAGAISVPVRQGVFKWANSAAADAITQQHAGLDCYVVDDQTVALTDALATRSRAGKIIQVDTDGVWVQTCISVRDIGGVNGAPQGQGSVVSIPVDLTQIATGQIVGAFNPGFAGRITKVQLITTKVATTGGKAATLTPRIAGTNVTGGVLALTSANQTPLGNVTAGTAVTAANVFTAAQNIDVQASAVTAFVEGAGVLLITLA